MVEDSKPSIPGAIVLGIDAKGNENQLVIGDYVDSSIKNQKNVLNVGDRLFIGTRLFGKSCNLKSLVTNYINEEE